MSEWGFSSSSEDESDDERPITKLKTNTEFYQNFQNGEYGADWPSNLRQEISAEQQNSNHAPPPMQNGHANDTTDDLNCTPTTNANGSMILSPSILNATPENIVLVNEGGKYRPIRVISLPELITSNNTPDAKPKAKRMKMEAPQMEEHEVPTIPLEKIDYIDPPEDPRRQMKDERGDDDEIELPLPKFWRETVLYSAIQKNQERNYVANGKFKQSNSYVREKMIQASKRTAMANQRRVDPRLERSLFSGPPRKVVTTTKSHNVSQPNMKSGSIFDDDVLDNVSSASSTSSMSPANSIESLPSVNDHDHFNAHSSTQVINNKDADFKSGSESDSESSGSDADYSFSSFNKKKLTMSTRRSTRATKRLESSSADEKVPPIKLGKVPPIKIDLKKKLVKTSTNKKPKPANLLHEKLPFVDKNDILLALTDDTSEDQEPNHVKVQTNGGKITNDAHNLKTHDEARETTPDDTFDRQNVAAAPEINKIDDMDEDTTNDVQFNDEPMEQAIESPPQEVNKTESDQSSTSFGSIEQRLADMTSPVKTAAEVRAEREAEELANMSIGGLVNQLEEQTQAQDTDLKVAEAVHETLSNDSGNHTATPSETNSECTVGSPNGQRVDVSSANVLISTHTSATDDLNKDPSTIDGRQVVSDVTAQINTTPPAQMNESFNGINGLPDIGANTEVFVPTDNINLDDYAKDLDTSTLSDIVERIGLGSTVLDSKEDTKPLQKTFKPRVYLNDYSEYAGKGQKLEERKPDTKKVPIDLKNISTSMKQVALNGVAKAPPSAANDSEVSDDDFDDDKPCGIDELTLPNSNTEQNASASKKLTSNCSLCTYKAARGWKQLVKHYVRKHSGQGISTISRLAFNLQELTMCPFTPLISKKVGEIMIQSLCYLCGEGYNMSSTKWLMHFISHTGEFEFRCNGCSKEIIQDLHKSCNSKDNERINGPHDFIENVLYGFVCSISQCNFIQLTKAKVMAHLENEHQLIDSQIENNIVEIPLLKIAQSFDLLEDNKNDEELMDAKQRIAVIHQTNRYESSEPLILSDEEVDPGDITIDLTMSDEDILF